jgi:hypothetical protein
VPAALKLPNRQQAAAEAANRVPGALRPKHHLRKVKLHKPRPRKVKLNNSARGGKRLKRQQGQRRER